MTKMTNGLYWMLRMDVVFKNKGGNQNFSYFSFLKLYFFLKNGLFSSRNFNIAYKGHT